MPHDELGPLMLPHQAAALAARPLARWRTIRVHRLPPQRPRRRNGRRPISVRPMPSAPPTPDRRRYMIGPLEFAPEDLCVSVAGKRVWLTRRELEVLEVLARECGSPGGARRGPSTGLGRARSWLQGPLRRGLHPPAARQARRGRTRLGPHPHPPQHRLPLGPRATTSPLAAGGGDNDPSTPVDGTIVGSPACNASRSSPTFMPTCRRCRRRCAASTNSTSTASSAAVTSSATGRIPTRCAR